MLQKTVIGWRHYTRLQEITAIRAIGKHRLVCQGPHNKRQRAAGWAPRIYSELFLRPELFTCDVIAAWSRLVLGTSSLPLLSSQSVVLSQV